MHRLQGPTDRSGSSHDEGRIRHPYDTGREITSCSVRPYKCFVAV
jgi:hypothetical protein